HEVQKAAHGGFRVQESLVHVDVDDLRAVFDLLACHRQRGLVVVLLDERPKTRGTGDVGALADVDKIRIGANLEWFEAGEGRVTRTLGRPTWCDTAHRL